MTLKQYLHNMSKIHFPDFHEWEAKNVRRIKIGSYSKLGKITEALNRDLGANKFASIKPKQCFDNALFACFANNEIHYVEGYIMIYGIPLEHAWNRWNGIDFDLTEEILNQEKVPHYEVMSLDSNALRFWMVLTGRTGPYRYEYFKQKNA